MNGDSGLKPRQLCKLDGRQTVGLLILANDSVIGDEMSTFLAHTPTLLQIERLPTRHGRGVDGLLRVGGGITTACARLPGIETLHSIAFGCTSSAVALGPSVVAQRARVPHPHVNVVDPATAILRALRVLNADRIGLVTPYSAVVNRMMESFLEMRGVQVVARQVLETSSCQSISDIPSLDILHASMRVAGRVELDALVVLCTSLRVSPILPILEEMTGLPVVTSVQALAWDCLRHGGSGSSRDPQLGQLFSSTLARMDPGAP